MGKQRDIERWVPQVKPHGEQCMACEIPPICSATVPCSDREYPAAGLPIHSFDEALQLIEQVSRMESRPPEDGDPQAWATVEFTRTDGAKLLIGPSDSGWLLVQLNTDTSPLKMSKGMGPK